MVVVVVVAHVMYVYGDGYYLVITSLCKALCTVMSAGCYAYYMYMCMYVHVHAIIQGTRSVQVHVDHLKI